MDRERVLEWADGDREDRGLVQPVEIEEESVVAKTYVREDRETDELASSSTASGVVLTTNGSAETLMDDISGMSEQSVSRIYVTFMTMRGMLPLGRHSSRSGEESIITLSAVSSQHMVGSLTTVDLSESLRTIVVFLGIDAVWDV